MITQTPAIAEIEKWLRIRVQFFTKFRLRSRVRNFDSGSCIHGHLWCISLTKVGSSAQQNSTLSSHHCVLCCAFPVFYL